ncbi:hypothetical protein D0T12_00440 [Actinomadura spongiicola]|uniref:Uncharacterized protein n=1 Tax=Actinomadura spongiicola TaxID=2303421 RepID=A0A372GN28_9ACTN|nr:hypothetical protein [Actinomadura spongiicola]RFS86798.1 hypothetical protein D0T12_00440 [Actinomadura spongiicola]
MNLLTMTKTPDEIYIVYAVRDGEERPVGTFHQENGDWWTGYYANGTRRRLWVPRGGPEEVTRRLFGGR